MHVFLLHLFPIINSLGKKVQHETGETGQHIHHEEVNIIAGALKFRDMIVSEVMTPMESAYMLPASAVLNFKVTDYTMPMIDIYSYGKYIGSTV